METGYSIEKVNYTLSVILRKNKAEICGKTFDKMLGDQVNLYQQIERTR